ncbi:MAG: thermonuclease family protein [Alphaproteobacteria bacterium]|nr:thermonuclease family protein [Alphaproteobacteria bacterium]
MGRPWPRYRHKPPTLVCGASVIDGDTLEIHGAHIRLAGIAAPESSQLWRGADSKAYRCGHRAALALSTGYWIAQRPVTCTPTGTDRSGRTVATCAVAGADMGAWLVAQGLALDWPRYSHGRYSANQRAAAAAQRGIHAGSFVNPSDYRRCMKVRGARAATCSDEAH